MSFARKTSPGTEKINLNEILVELVAITDLAAYSKISIKTRLDGQLPPVYGSESEIQQVFLNLINNAIYALEKDGGTISISSELEDYLIDHGLPFHKDSCGNLWASCERDTAA